MDTVTDTAVEPPDDLAPLVARLNALRELVQRISDEASTSPPRSVEPLIERHRAAMYAAMDRLGLAINAFRYAHPEKEKIEAARDLVVGQLRAWAATSPVFFRSWQGPRRQFHYFELVEHVSRKLAAGADVPAMLFNDYYVHSVAAQAFRNRLVLLGQRLREAVGRQHAEGCHPVRVVSLQYVGGRELQPIAERPELVTNLHVTCLDGSVTAVRHAEQTCGAAFKGRSQMIMAEPERWLYGPACPRDAACVVYVASLLEQRDDKAVVRILNGVHELLREGGVLVLGSVTPVVPLGEQVLREWMLGWNWRYRDAADWQRLFAQTPFGAQAVEFEYEPLRANLLVSVRRDL